MGASGLRVDTMDGGSGDEEGTALGGCRLPRFPLGNGGEAGCAPLADHASLGGGGGGGCGGATAAGGGATAAGGGGGRGGGGGGEGSITGSSPKDSRLGAMGLPNGGNQGGQAGMCNCNVSGVVIKVDPTLGAPTATRATRTPER